MPGPNSISLGNGVTLDNTLGAFLIGSFFSMSLWGVICTQTYDYFMNRNNTDGRLQRSIVALLWLIDTVGSAMHAHVCYYYLIAFFSLPNPSLKVIWSINYIALITGLLNFIIRLMFVRRIYQFGQKNLIVPIWIMLISLTEFVVNIVTTARAYLGLNSALLYISFALCVTADLSVTIALSWLLHSAKTGFRQSDSVVNVLMAYVVNTGLLVTLLSVVGLMAFIFMPNNMIFLSVWILVSKLYVSAYLATLNARGRLKGTINLKSEGISLSRLGASNSQGRDTALHSDEKVHHDIARTRRNHELWPSHSERHLDDTSYEVKN